MRIKSLSTFKRKLTIPARRGSQNSKNLKRMVMAIESTLLNPDFIRIYVIETSIAPRPLRKGEIIRNITTTMYAIMADGSEGASLKACIAI